MTQIYIIAEAGVNHNGSLEIAKELVEIAAEAGADAVKFQTFNAEKVISSRARKALYQQKTTGEKGSQLEMVKKLELAREDHYMLKQLCEKRKIDFLSTPFDQESLGFLAGELNLPLIKVSSGDLTNAPFLLDIARMQKPVIMSTGMSNLGEVEAALGVLAYGYLSYSTELGKLKSRDFIEAYSSKEGQNSLNKNVTLLHCTTEYPALFTEINLRAMDTLKKAFGLPVGFSDHSEGISAAIAAAAREACVIEKHFTLDNDLPGPDHTASLNPKELQVMISSIREVEQALGSMIKSPSSSELNNMKAVRRSLVAAISINKGDIITKEKIAVKRTEGGLPPQYYFQLVGEKALKNYKKDDILTLTIKDY